MRFLSNIKLRTKLLAIIIALSVPIIYLSFLYVSERLSSIHDRQSEISGLEYQSYVYPVVEYMAQHRGLSSGYLGGAEHFKDKILFNDPLCVKRNAIS